MTLIGFTGTIINVEVDISNGFPGWDIVGLPDMSIKESKERISVALKNCGVSLLSKKYVINLSPADIKKEGSKMDLAIAIGILKELGVMSPMLFNNYMIVGEISLDGTIKPIVGAFAICMEAKELGIKNIIIPFDNFNELVSLDGINIYGIKSLSELINCERIELRMLNKSISNSKSTNTEYVDFKDIIGQYDCKRGLEIAASGGHNLRMIGPVGAGKTILAKALVGILPDLSMDERLELNKIYSLANKRVESGLVCSRPFRNPHYSITKMGLIGGGNNFQIGEITLAHRGVLFLDELTEFKPKVLELLRSPIEDGFIVLSRGNYTITYPSRFMLICAMNPCSCGNLGSKYKQCTCSEKEIINYSRKISSPFLDRIDININVQIVQKDEYMQNNSESTEEIKQRVNQAREIQKRRYTNDDIYCNAELNVGQIKKYCILDDMSKDLLLEVINSKQLSVRTYYKIIKIARTIADIDNSESIKIEHIIEAIHYKNI